MDEKHKKQSKSKTTLFHRLKNFPDTLKWIASLMGGFIAIILAFAQLTPYLEPIIKKYQSPLPSNLIVFISPDSLMAKSYLSILADNGFETKYLDLIQIDELPSLRPGVVIIGSNDSSKIEMLKLSQSLKNYLIGNIKIIGMGRSGELFFYKIAPLSVLNHVAWNSDTQISLNSKVPHDITIGLPTSESLHLYNVPSEEEHQAVYDSGSLSLQGAQGIAQENVETKCRGHYWPVVKQGNYAFWGYSFNAQRLTETGKTLFVNLVKHLQSTPYEEPEFDTQYLKPGIYSGTLGCNFIDNNYLFKVSRTGDIRLSVASDVEVSLILNRLDRMLGQGGFSRVDQASPELIYHVTKEDIKQGNAWEATIDYFGEASPETYISYTLEINYPNNEPNPLLWSLVGLTGVGFFVFAIFRLRKVTTLQNTNQNKKKNGRKTK